MTDIGRILLAQEPPDDADRPCRDEECRARRELVCAADAFAHRLTPNTMNYLTPADAQLAFDRYGRNIDALEQSSPSRIRLYCKLLAQVAATIRGIDAHEPSNGERDWTAEIVGSWAVNLDRPENHCLTGVLAAMPKTPAVQGDGDVRWANDCRHRVRTCRRELKRTSYLQDVGGSWQSV